MKAKEYAKYIGKWYLGHYKDMPHPVRLTEVCTTLRGANSKRGTVKLIGDVYNFNHETGQISTEVVARNVTVDLHWLGTTWEACHIRAVAEAKAALRKRVLLEEATRLYSRVTGRHRNSVYRPEMGWSLNLQEWQSIEQHLLSGGWNQWPLLQEKETP